MYFPSKFTNEKKFVYSLGIKSRLPVRKIITMTLYFLQTVNVTISEVNISNSTGAGLLGINMLGLSNVFQTVFNSNKPKCLSIIFTTSKIHSPTVFSIVNSWFTFGSTHTQGCDRFEYATGLSVELAQTTYKVYTYINNIN